MMNYYFNIYLGHRNIALSLKKKSLYFKFFNGNSDISKGRGLLVAT
jgi:hypothetical protein